MAVSVGDLLDSVSTTLLDTARRTWTHDDLVLYLREAVAATANIKPDLYPRQEYVPLVAGITQTLPDDGIALLEVQLNEVSGRVVRQVDRDLLDEANRSWPAATRETDVYEYAADARDPRRFAVTPPNDGAGSVQVLYGAMPTVTGSSGEELPIAASYLAPLTMYVLGKCYQQNTKRYDPAKAQAYLNQWGTMIGMKSKAQIAVAPHVAVSESGA